MFFEDWKEFFKSNYETFRIKLNFIVITYIKWNHLECTIGLVYKFETFQNI